jgi:hypothetical protein
MDRDRDGDRYTDTNIDIDMDPAEIYADGPDTPRKLFLRGLIPRINLLRGI